MKFTDKEREQRLLRGCDFEYLKQKYTNVAFNIRDWHNKSNDIAHGKYHLLATEGYITIPGNYDMNNIKKYRTFITPNSKFIELHGHEHPMILLKGNTFWNDYYELPEAEFVSYKDKIRGIVMLNKLYHTQSQGDIVYLRDKVLTELEVEPELLVHLYSYHPWGGRFYQGNLPYGPSHIENQRKLSKYLYSICFESCYHPLWSWDWITERIINCFRTKTVAIYLGCYNIEQHIPTNLFIDYRQFDFDNKKLSEYLLNFTETQYIDMVEAAYDWYKTKNKLGTILELEEILENLK